MEVFKNHSVDGNKRKAVLAVMRPPKERKREKKKGKGKKHDIVDL